MRGWLLIPIDFCGFLRAEYVIPLASTRERDVGIDVTRAGLILMMLVYHCFGHAQLITTLHIDQAFNVNRWMGLVTGSFPFLVGFLIGFRYMGDESHGFSLIRGLTVRSSKIIGLFFAANIVLVIFSLAVDEFPVRLPNTPNMQNLLLADAGYVVYDLLMPLGEIILIGAGILLARMYYKNDLILQCALIIGAIILAWSGNLLPLYLACGMVGIALGSLFARPVVKNALQRYWGICLMGFVPGIFLSVTETNGPDNSLLYLASVAGLFFAFQNLGRFGPFTSQGVVSRITILFARGSLMIYIVHIPILPFVAKLVGPLFAESDLWLAFSFLLVIMLLSMGALTYFVDLYGPRFNQNIFNLKLLLPRFFSG